MKNIGFLIAVLLVSSFGIAQNNNELKLYSFSTTGIKSAERARYIDKKLTDIDAILFCRIEKNDQSGLILANGSVTESEVFNILNNFNYSLSSFAEIDYSIDTFFFSYVNVKNNSTPKGLESEPLMNRTGHPEKDQFCYELAHDFWTNQTDNE